MIKASNLLTRIPPFFSDLAKTIAGDIDCSRESLLKYSNDNSPYFVTPQAIIYPKNTIDIKHVLSFAREYTMPVTARGSGSSRTGGALGEGIIIDMTRYFSQIRSVNIIENTITVDAGVTVSSLLEKLHGWHFDIPFLSLKDSDATIGGMVATKSATPTSFTHGTIREWIEGMTVVVDTGEEHRITDGITPSGRLLGIYQKIFPFLSKESGVLRASKPELHDDATGYNLWNTSIGPRQLLDQLVGSEGTLGIITSVTFRITPHKHHSSTTCIPIHSKEHLLEYIELAKQHRAESIFMYDEGFMQLSERYHPTITPFFVDTPYILLVTHTHSNLEKLHHAVKTFQSTLPVEEYLLKTIDGSGVLARILPTSFLYSLFDMYTNNTQLPITVADGLIVNVQDIPSFLYDLEEYLNTLGRVYSITGNIGSGHVCVTTAFDPKAKNYSKDIVTYAASIFLIVKKYKGGISAVSGEGLAKTPHLSYVYTDAAISAFKNIKEMWDPLSILNPGKKNTTTAAYLEQRTQRT